MTHHGDAITSIASGVALSIAANAAGWVGGKEVMAHAGATLLYGILGGVGGWVGKRLVERLALKWREARINKNANNKR